MIVKVKFVEKPYFSHVFLVGVSNYRERFVVFNDKTEKFELIYSTKDKDYSTRYVYTFDYTYNSSTYELSISNVKSSNGSYTLGTSAEFNQYNDTLKINVNYKGEANPIYFNV